MGHYNKDLCIAVFQARLKCGDESKEHKEAQKQLIKSQEKCPHPPEMRSLAPVKKDTASGYKAGTRLSYCLRCSLVLEKNIA